MNSNILSLLGLGGSNGLINIALGGQSSGSSNGNSNGHQSSQTQNGGSSASNSGSGQTSQNGQSNGGLLNVDIGGGNGGSSNHGGQNSGSSSQSGGNAFHYTFLFLNKKTFDDIFCLQAEMVVYSLLIWEQFKLTLGEIPAAVITGNQTTYLILDRVDIAVAMEVIYIYKMYISTECKQC